MTKQRMIGTFGKKSQICHFGEIFLNASNTVIEIYGNDLSEMADAETIYGVSHNRERLTLLGCTRQGLNHSIGAEGLGEKAEIFPHFVLSGWNFFDQDIDNVDEVSFTLSDIRAIFQDEEAFNTVMDARSHLEKIYGSNTEGDQQKIYDGAILSYFNGCRVPFQFETSIGKISLINVPTISSRGPFSTAMQISISFVQPIKFSEAINRILGVRHFLSVIAGRPQGVAGLKVHTVTTEVGIEHARNWLKVYWSISPMESHYVQRIRLNDFDLPVHAVRDNHQFASIFQKWFARYEDLRVPRYRYIECMEYGADYNVARLVTAANMFDLLPDDMVPVARDLSKEILDAAEKAKKLFKELPDSPDRSSMLTSIGLLGKPSLPKKVSYRSKIVRSHLSHCFPDLEKLLKIAVKTRNHFVHGSPLPFEKVEDFLALMTDALEFAFIVSDLIECGWQANIWSHKPKTANHPFSRFLVSYREGIDGFNAATPSL